MFEARDSLRRILEGGVERIGLPDASLRVKGQNQTDNFSRLVNAPDHTAAVGVLMDWIEERGGSDALTAVGHRVVHGGPKYSEPQRINAEMVEELHRLSPFDPEHLAFRLYDWDHVDPKTGQRRPLQIDQALACVDFTQVAVRPVAPVVEKIEAHKRELLFLCEHFGVWRTGGEAPFKVGAADTPRVLVCIDGEGRLEHGGANYGFDRGDVLLLPASVGACSCRPLVEVSLLEISLPEAA